MRITGHAYLVRSLFAILLLSSSAGTDALWADAPTQKTEPHFQGLGKHTRHVSTQSPEAQQYFDQGLIFLYGFNHDEAIRSFEAAAAKDPKCAMAYWGIAMANGPHINSPSVDNPHAKAAWQALKQAREHLDGATPVEKALIEALAARYADPQPEDRHPLDKAFADAMRKVWTAYPEDADVGALTAEAIMDLRPWDQWTPKGKPQPGHRGGAGNSRRGHRQMRPRIRWRCICTFTPTRHRCIPNGPTPPRPGSAIWIRRSGTWCTCRRTSTSAAAAGKRRS